MTAGAPTGRARLDAQLERMTADFLLMRQAITCAADHIGIVPAHLDHVLWKYERSRESGVQ